MRERYKRKSARLKRSLRSSEAPLGTAHASVPSPAPRFHSVVRWVVPAAVVVASIALAGALGQRGLNRLAEVWASDAIHHAYGGRLRAGHIRVRLFPAVRVSADGIVLAQDNRPGLPPFVTAERVLAGANFIDILRRPVHVSFVRIEGLNIHVPPRRGDSVPATDKKSDNQSGFVIDELRADHAKLEILPKDADKQPLDFDIHQLTMNDAGGAGPMKFRTVLINAKPPGEIRSSGNFGPLQVDDPATSLVDGSYTFQNADLSVFTGIAGILSSEGKYRGTLDHIGVEGKTETPNFRLLISGNPVPLTTQFQAVVDGMNGDVSFSQVNAMLGHTAIAVRGSIDGTKGVPGRTIRLNAAVSRGRLENLLRLVIKGPVPMTGEINFHSAIFIPPGQIKIPNKLHLDGKFNADEAQFGKVNMQDRIDKLSDRGRGDTHDDGGDVASNFQGTFNLNDGVMKLTGLSFHVPGVQVALTGTYGLTDEKLDMHGTASLEAKISQTVTGFKSLLLKAVDPIFEKKGKGAVVPIRIGVR